jgi:hypothetical protein
MIIARPWPARYHRATGPWVPYMVQPTVRSRWRFSRWVSGHPWRTFGLVVLAGVLLLNILAYRHAGAMLTYRAGVARTPTPQSLSRWEKAQVLVSGISLPRPENARSPADVGLSAETVRFAAADGVTLEGWLVAPPEPRGTVLLFPGCGAAKSSPLPEAQAFHDLGFVAVLVDFRGTGGSEKSVNSLGYDEANDVAAAVRHARERALPRPLVLYGQPGPVIVPPWSCTVRKIGTPDWTKLTPSTTIWPVGWSWW